MFQNLNNIYSTNLMIPPLISGLSFPETNAQAAHIHLKSNAESYA